MEFAPRRPAVPRPDRCPNCQTTDFGAGGYCARCCAALVPPRTALVRALAGARIRRVEQQDRAVRVVLADGETYDLTAEEWAMALVARLSTELSERRPRWAFWRRA